MANVPDFSHLSSYEAATVRAEFRISYGKLRRAFPMMLIPDFDDRLPLAEIWIGYERYVRQVYAEQSAHSYRNYLVIGLCVMELGLIKLGLPADGLVLSHIESISTYDRLLIELGERNWSSHGGQWPLELRIGMVVLINSGVFIVMKYLTNWMGEASAKMIMDKLKTFLIAPNPPPPQQYQQQQPQQQYPQQQQPQQYQPQQPQYQQQPQQYQQQPQYQQPQYQQQQPQYQQQQPQQYQVNNAPDMQGNAPRQPLSMPQLPPPSGTPDIASANIMGFSLTNALSFVGNMIRPAPAPTAAASSIPDSILTPPFSG